MGVNPMPGLLNDLKYQMFIDKNHGSLNIKQSLRQNVNSLWAID